MEDLQRDLDRECSACGPVEKITVFERHPEGVSSHSCTFTQRESDQLRAC